MNRVSPRLAVAFACVALASRCAGSGSPSLSSLTAPSGPSSLSSLRPADVYDGYPVDPAPVDPPGTVPPDPAVPIPVPTAPTLTIDIVGAVGAAAFAPNPLEGAIGALLAWKNSDLFPHHIVLDDGTVVGNLAPGQTSVPLPMATPTIGYHCTLHPTMVGSISVPGAPPPLPAPPAGVPVPPSEPPPYDYYRVPPSSGQPARSGSSSRSRWSDSDPRRRPTCATSGSSKSVTSRARSRSASGSPTAAVASERNFA